jgi:hypothetical protein
MPRRKSPRRNRALLAAHRLNSRRWTSQRTLIGQPKAIRVECRLPSPEDASVPDWTVPISVWPGRGQGPRRARSSVPEDKGRPHRLGMLRMVSAHSTGWSEPAEAREGERPEPKWERTKPESYTIESSSQNIWVASDCGSGFAAGHTPGERLICRLNGWGRRTKPESNTIESSSQNMSVPPDCGSGFAAGHTPWKEAHPPVERVGKRTKPEYLRKESAYENMSKRTALRGVPSGDGYDYSDRKGSNLSQKSLANMLHRMV